MIFVAIVVLALVSLVALATLSFTLRSGPLRRRVRIATVVLGCVCVLVPVLLFVGLGILFGDIPGPPSIASLAEHFPERRRALEQLVSMSNADPRLVRVDPGFFNSMGVAGVTGQVGSYGEQHSDLPKARWDQYRTFFHQAGLKQGFVRDPNGDIFFLANSAGMLDMGYSTGYLFCAPAQPRLPLDSPYPACSLNTQSGSYSATNQSDESYAFKKVADQWLVYKRGAF